VGKVRVDGDASALLELLESPGRSKDLLWEIKRRISELKGRQVFPAEEVQQIWAIALGLAERLLEMETTLQKREFQSRFRDVELEAVSHLGRVLASTFEVERLMETVLDLAVTISNARCGALWLFQEGKWEVVGVVGDAGLVVRQVLASAQVPNEAQLLPRASHRLGVALASDREVLGYLVVGDQERRRGVGPFRAEDRRTLELLANQATVALQNSYLHRQVVAQRLLEREIALASEIQRRFLPESLPQVPGLDIWAWNRAARYVSGDYFQFFVDPHASCLRIAIGDVSGKGVPAALLVSLLHSALVLLLRQDGFNGTLLSQLNEHLFSFTSKSKFVTLILAELDPEHRTLTYLNAGHPPGLVVRADGKVEELSAGGLPLGLFARGSWPMREVPFGEGDLLCLYSDGVVEAIDSSGVEYGAERLVHLLQGGKNVAVSQLGPTVAAALESFPVGGALEDDCTLLLVRFVARVA
jgi:serine phosphatase RsbU (regulator of sigma subunit)